MPPPRGPRGERVTVVAWTAEDGTQYFDVYAAAGTRATKHKSAEDARKELTEAGYTDIIVQTVTVK